MQESDARDEKSAMVGRKFFPPSPLNRAAAISGRKKLKNELSLSLSLLFFLFLDSVRILFLNQQKRGKTNVSRTEGESRKVLIRGKKRRAGGCNVLQECWLPRYPCLPFSAGLADPMHLSIGYVVFFFVRATIRGRRPLRREDAVLVSSTFLFVHFFLSFFLN